MAIRVLKFGGSSLASIELVKSVAERVAQMRANGDQVVIVVSAMGSTTNELISLAQQISSNPHRRELDMLISTGERVSMSLMSMALNDLNCPAISFTGSQAGVLTDSSHTGANIIEVKAFRVVEELNKGKVVVLAGFQGVCPSTKEITTLGRGGTDTTAVAMAEYLKADSCEMYKDFEGIFQADPKRHPQAKALKELSYDQLIELCTAGAKVVHSKAVHYAKKAKAPIQIRKAHPFTNQCTLINESSKFDKNCIGLNHNANVREIKSNSPISIDEFYNKLQIIEQRNQNSDSFIISIVKESDYPMAFLRGTTSSLDFFKNSILESDEVTFCDREYEEVNLCFTDFIENIELDSSYYLHRSTYGKTLSFICLPEQSSYLEALLFSYI